MNTNTKTVAVNPVVENIKSTYLYFAGAMLAASTGAYLGIPYASIITDNYWYIAIPWMLFGIFGLAFIQMIPKVNLVGLYIFAFLGGIIITPLLSNVLSMPGGSGIVINAFAMTSVLFASLSFFAMTTEKDFRSYGKGFIIAFFVMIIFSLINVFFFQSSIAQLLIQGIIFFIIVFLVIYDTQKVASGEYTPIQGAIALFLDFLNMFSILLQFLGIMNSSDD